MIWNWGKVRKINYKNVIFSDYSVVGKAFCLRADKNKRFSEAW